VAGWRRDDARCDVGTRRLELSFHHRHPRHPDVIVHDRDGSARVRVSQTFARHRHILSPRQVPQQCPNPRGKNFEKISEKPSRRKSRQRRTPHRGDWYANVKCSSEMRCIDDRRNRTTASKWEERSHCCSPGDTLVFPGKISTLLAEHHRNFTLLGVVVVRRRAAACVACAL
jgi:hypothetical protein